MMRRFVLGVLLVVIVPIVGFAVWAIVTNQQDRPRANDQVLRQSRSPDQALDAFLVIRVADSLSADVLKVFVAPAGRPWAEGEMAMLGRRFSSMGNFYWADNELLCLVASEDGIEEQRDRARIAGRDVRFIVRPTADDCFGP